MKLVRESPTTFVLMALFAVGCNAPATAVTPHLQLDAGTSTLAITVAGVHSDKGQVICSLFNSADGFPGGSPIIGGTVEAPATTGDMPCSFEKLPAGTYAVLAIHDEDDNGSLDRGAIGPPTEGYGVTNNNVPATSAPTYDAAAVTLGDGQSLPFTINLKY